MKPTLKTLAKVLTEDRTLPIEKGVPIPPRRRAGRYSRYPLSAMKVGDSFFAPGVANASRAAVIWFRWKRATGRNAKFTARREGVGVRIWRIK